MRKRIVLAVISVIILLIIIGIAYFFSLATFPGSIKETDHKVTTDGIKSKFRKGVIYRYPNMVPLLEVSGDHYEMGLQYGVLLKPEILEAIKSYDKILRWQAVKMGVPHSLLTAIVKYKAGQMSERLPERFLREIDGVSEGSGVPAESILTISLFYDVGESMGCTGLLMRGESGTVIHGRNQDTSDFGGEDLGRMTVVVRYNATGFNSVTHFDYPLYMGLDTGYNDRGLAFSEETLSVKKPNPDGFPILYLSRVALEECSSIDELLPLFDKYSVIGAYGCVWSDRDDGRGIVSELTSKGWSAQELKGSILWNFNHIYSEKLKEHQHPRCNIIGTNWDREKVASLFPKKPIYDVKDAILFLRAQKAHGGFDYSWYGARRPICNWAGQQMVIFHPNGDGVYLAIGLYYAARQRVYHIHDDFSKKPELFMEAVPLRPVVEDVAMVENMLISKEKKLDRFIDLAKKYPDDANMQFLVAYNSFKQKRMDIFAGYAEKAFSMNHSIVEYKLYAGMAVYQKRDIDKAVGLLEGIDSSELYPLQEIYRLAVLERAMISNVDRSSGCREQREAIIKRHGAESYFESSILPLINALDD